MTSRDTFRSFCADWRRRYTDEELVEQAEHTKSMVFEHYLHNDAHTARWIALGLICLGRESHLPYIVGLGVLAKADAIRKIGRLDDAKRYFDQAGQIFRAADSSIGWARAQTGWIVAASDYGEDITPDILARMDEVCQLLQQMGEFKRLSNIQQNMGIAYANRGQFPKAIAHWNAALESLKNLRGPESDAHTARIIGNMAFVDLWQGQFESAFARLVEVRTRFHDLEWYSEVALADLRLSMIEQARGHLAESMRYAIAARDEAMKRGLLNTTALALLAQAKILLKLNRIDEAEAASAQALHTLREQHDANDLVDALCTHAEALVRLTIKNRRDALELLRQAGEITNQYSHPYTYRIALERAAILLKPDKDQDMETRRMEQIEARDLTAEVAERCRANDVLIHRYMALLVQAEAMLALGEMSAAQTQVEQLLAQGIETVGREVIYRGHLLLARIVRQQGNLSGALAHYDAMTQMLGAFVDELAYDRGADFLEDKDALYMEALTTALDADQPARALRYLEQLRARSAWLATSGDDPELEELRREHSGIIASLSSWDSNEEAAKALKQVASLDRKIAERIAAHAQRITSQEAVDIDAILRAIPAGSAAIVYVMTAEALIIFVLTEGYIQYRAIPLAKIQPQFDLTMNVLLARLHSYSTKTSADSPDDKGSQQDTITPGSVLAQPRLVDIQDDLHALWSVLFKPIARYLPPDGGKHKGKLFFVPHGVLHEIPFAALFDGSQYCVERWVTHTLYSCQALIPKTGNYATKSADRNHVEVLRTLLALGYPGKNHKLPRVPHEAESVAWQTGGISRVNERATIALLRAEAPGRCYLHLAAHGEVLLEAPYSSYIELHDGNLHPLDVLTLPLHQCRLVVLSACETGRSKTRGGDEQVGLVRAFGLAGAHAAVATLWQVDDIASAVLMRLFYEHLVAGATPADALYAAQHAFITGYAGDNLRSPYYWAGYQFVAFALDA